MRRALLLLLLFAICITPAEAGIKSVILPKVYGPGVVSGDWDTNTTFQYVLNTDIGAMDFFNGRLYAVGVYGSWVVYAFDTTGDQLQTVWTAISDPTPNTDFAEDIYVEEEESALYIVGGQNWSLGPVESVWRVEKRNLNGDLLISDTYCDWDICDHYNNVAFSVEANASSGNILIGGDTDPSGAPIHMVLGIADSQHIFYGADTMAVLDRVLMSSNMNGYGCVGITEASDGYIDGFGVTIRPWVIKFYEAGNLKWGVYHDMSYHSPKRTCAHKDGVIFTGGYIESGTDDYLAIEARNTTNGDLIWYDYYNPSDSDDRLLGVASDGSYVYLTGISYVYTPHGEARIEKRDADTGEIIWVVYELDPGGGYASCGPIAVSDTSIYVECHMANVGYLIEKRRKSDGSL